MVVVRGGSHAPRRRLLLALLTITVACFLLYVSQDDDTMPIRETGILLLGIPNSGGRSTPVLPKRGSLLLSRNHLPPIASCRPGSQDKRMPLLSLDKVRGEVSKYYKMITMQQKRPDFAEIGRRLLYRAMFLNQTLLTFQIGGMDGISNDPMYRMFLRDPGQRLPTRHWIPVVVEGNAVNFKLLSQNYRNFSQQHGMFCSSISHWAISYNQEDKGSGVCRFCRFDVSETALPVCKSQPDWLQTQVGTVNCEHSKKAMGDKFDKCIVRDEVECGSTLALFRQKVGLLEAASRISMLQIDTEGYEGILLPKLLVELSQHGYELPPVIHFESKILRRWRQKGKNRQLQDIYDLLKSNGYYILEGIEDDLAIQTNNDS